MNKKQIETRQEALSSQFTLVQQEIVEKEAQLQQLRGRWSELEELKKSLEVDVPGDMPQSNIVEAVPAENEEKTDA